MNSLKLSLEIDVKPAAGAAAHKTRAGNHGRHHEKMPDLFPDVLADVALSKNVAVEAPGALVPPIKSTIRDDEVDTGDKEQGSPPEEKIPQPAIPIDMKQYLQVIAAVAQTQAGGGEPVIAAVAQKQVGGGEPAIAAVVQKQVGGGEPVIAAFAQKQTGGGEPAPPPVIAVGVLPLVASRSETPSAITKQTEDDVAENTPKDVVDPDAPKFPEFKAPDPRKLVERNDKSSPTSSIGPPGAENLPEPDGVFQPKAPKEISPPKAAEVELRVIKVETSFSPAASTPFVVQVAKIIADGLDGPVHSPVAVIGNPVFDPRPDVVKSIQIQLHPDDLGKIKVAMHLRGDELRLHIEVTNKAVETLLLSDHQALKDLMGQAGYDIGDASISIAVSPADLNPPQRSVAASNPSQDSLVGQGGRQHPGTSEENQNPFQKARGHYASASDFENGGEAKVLAPGPRRGNGVFV